MWLRVCACSPLSVFRQVPIYQAQTLNSQLDSTAADFLRTFVKLSPGKRVVHLPRIIQYFKEDFGGSSTLDILSFVRRFLNRQQQHDLDNMLNGIGFGAQRVKLRYLDLGFSSRILELRDPWP